MKSGGDQLLMLCFLKFVLINLFSSKNGIVPLYVLFNAQKLLNIIRSLRFICISTNVLDDKYIPEVWTACRKSPLQYIKL